MIWLEYGGTKGSNVMYCCGVSANTRREKTLIVEGIKTHIVEDAALAKLDELTDQPGGGKARATVVGRYFAGVKRELPGGTFWMGYGHMGMASLFVIERVVSAEAP